MRLFISYSSADDNYFQVFKNGLEARVKNLPGWELWTDQSIQTGDPWHEAIQENVTRCDCAILLLSPYFLSSSYIEEHELRHFFEQHEQGDTAIVPVAFVSCRLDQHPELAKRQIFKPKGKDYNQPELPHICFSDLVQFDKHHQPIENNYRERFLDALVMALERIALRKASKTQGRGLPAKSPGTQQAPVLQIGGYSPDAISRGLESILPGESHFDQYRQALTEYKFLQANLNAQPDQLALASEMANKLNQLVFEQTGKLTGIIYDSDYLKSRYPSVHFNEILFQPELEPVTEQAINEKRQQRARFPWSDRSLIVSALTLRLLNRFEEKAAYHLLDFVRDKEEFVWKKALVGLVFAYLQHEKRPGFVPPKYLLGDITILRNDPAVQEALVEIVKILADNQLEASLDRLKEKVRFDEKFEFFQQPQHWFLPFNAGNPILDENIIDPTLREWIVENTEWTPDALKFAFCLKYRQLSVEERQAYAEQLKRAHELLPERYLEIKSQYPNQEPARALRLATEIGSHLAQIYFFQRFYSGESQRRFVLEKVVFYNSTLGELLAQELWINKIRAIWYYFENNYEAAEPYFEQVVAAEPENFYYLTRLGRVLRHLGKVTEAIAVLERAMAIYDDNPWTLDELARCYIDDQFENKDPEKSMFYRRQATAFAPNYYWNLWGIATYYEQKGEYEAALAYRQRLVELESEDADNWGMLGYVFAALGRIDEAIAARKKAENINPDLVWNLNGLAWCYQQKKDFETALAYRQKVADLEPDNAEAWQNLGFILGELGQIDEAIIARKRAEELDPDLALNLSNLAWCYQQKNDFQTALAYRQRVVELEPEKAENWGNLGFILGEHLGRIEEAIEARKKSEKIKPSLVWNLRGLAWSYHQIKDLETALAYRQKVADLEPENAIDLSNLAWCYQQKNDFQTALVYRQRVVELEPESAENWGNLGYVLGEGLERIDEAIEARKKAEELNSELVWNLRGLAWCYLQKKDFQTAVQYQNRVAALEPENASNLLSLAELYFQAGKQLEASQSLQKAVEIAREDASTIHSVGWAYFVAGIFPDAKKYFIQSLELGFSDRHANMNLGHIYLIEQNEPEALENYRLSFEKADDVERHLKGFEEDYPHLEKQGIDKEHYWSIVRQAQALAGK